jgi:hypothetical protein
MAGNYHTAKTLEKGTSQFGLTFSATKYSYTTTNPSTGASQTVNVALPNLLPELTYHIGLGENSEAGGRVALGSFGGELDFKYRFLRSDKLHLAIAPAIGYQAFVIVEGGTLRLPAIATYELADNLDFNVAAFASEAHYKTIDSNIDYSSLHGSLTSTGGAIGFDLHGEVMSIRPAVEFSRYVVGTDNSFHPFNVVNFMVHIAWTGGREMKKLKEMDKKLDRIDDKLDRIQPQQPPPSPYPPPPAPYPQPAPPPGPPPGPPGGQ